MPPLFPRLESSGDAAEEGLLGPRPGDNCPSVAAEPVGGVGPLLHPEREPASFQGAFEVLHRHTLLGECERDPAALLSTEGCVEVAGVEEPVLLHWIRVGR